MFICFLREEYFIHHVTSWRALYYLSKYFRLRRIELLISLRPSLHIVGLWTCSGLLKGALASIFIIQQPMRIFQYLLDLLSFRNGLLVNVLFIVSSGSLRRVREGLVHDNVRGAWW